MNSINSVQQRIMEIQKRFRMLTPQRFSKKVEKPEVPALSKEVFSLKNITPEAKELKVEVNLKNTIETHQNSVLKGGSNPYSKIVTQKAKEYGLPETLLRALIEQESGWKKDAVSKKGAMGLMQLMPDTADLLGVIDPYSPEENIDGGVRYLKNLLGQFSGDIVKALAAYNAGVRAVETQKGVPKYEETQDYVRKIIDKYMEYSGVSSK